MCGITGVFNYNSDRPIDPESLNRMCASIAHRGPDDQGMFFDNDARIGLGHRRLSIIDLATGAQPMSSADKNIWIVFNGEIYNFPELKKELTAGGFRFKTTSDTEVIIYLYQAYREKALERLNGIFALAIYDKKERSLLLARDKFGVKPLYYHDDGQRISFGSEIKAILQDKTFTRNIDLQALDNYLTFRYSPSPQTLIRGINKLSPGHGLKIMPGREPWQFRFDNKAPKTDRTIKESDAVARYQELLENAVKRQMISDVPVGLFLSGGVDSAVLGTLMQKNHDGKLKTFSIGFRGKGDHNELDDARETARWIGSEHHEMLLEKKDYLDFFARSFYYVEEPVAETTIPALYYVSKLAARDLKVVLAGQGADEPMAGYPRYFGISLILKYPRLWKNGLVKSLIASLPRNERAKRTIYAGGFDDELDRFLAAHTIFTPEQKISLVREPPAAARADSARTLMADLYGRTSSLGDPLSKLLYIDARMNLSDDLLLFNDKMAMANSLEMRVPYLDLELMDFLESLPVNLKLRGRTGKYIHKKAAGKWLPGEIINRKKRGFATPMDQWLQSGLSDTAKRLFALPDSACRQYFNLDYINGLIDSHIKRRHNYQRHIFMLLSFEIWHKTFFENKKIDLVS
ncbi:MAG: asparagine synthase (glutamine-hydrolyzing) [Candidatus Edwardsbacteria bacterium]|nr:asparagine synthase (glutamine-hydrolyzing) [Candidatus Edwardsbacteria bacterium]